MSLILKFVFSLVLLLALAEAFIHDHYKKEQYSNKTHQLKKQNFKNVIDAHIFGTITCKGFAVDNLHPYLHSENYPGTIINSVKTNKSGEYHLYTGTLPATLKTVRLSIKHQCRIAELPPIEGCPFPYYTTTTVIYLRSNLISYDFELFEMRFYSTANCSDHDMFSDNSEFSNLPEFKPFCGKDAELARISCINGSEHEYLWNGTIDFSFTRRLIKESVTVIGIQEMRKALHFQPPPSWTSLNTSYPFDEEIDEAPTLEAYYELEEQRTIVRHLKIKEFFDHNISRGIEFLDNRNPVIREVFKCRFGNMVSREIGRKTIDGMISELYYFTIKGLFYDVIEEEMASSECYSKLIPDNNF